MKNDLVGCLLFINSTEKEKINDHLQVVVDMVEKGIEKREEISESTIIWFQVSSDSDDFTNPVYPIAKHQFTLLASIHPYKSSVQELIKAIKSELFDSHLRDLFPCDSGTMTDNDKGRYCFYLNDAEDDYDLHNRSWRSQWKEVVERKS